MNDPRPRGRRRVTPPEHNRKTSAVAGVLLSLGLFAAAPPSANASPAAQMRLARFALIRGDDVEAAKALEAARQTAPATARGLEAALLLADLHFSHGRTDQARKILGEAEAVAEGPPATAITIARGWLALSHGASGEADKHFRRASHGASTFARALAEIGAAWAALSARRPLDNPYALEAIARGDGPPALRFGAGWTLARAHRSGGESQRALRALRRLRRELRQTSYEDDVELTLGLAQLEAGRVRQARRTFRRLERKFGPARSGPPPIGRLQIQDLRDSDKGLVSRISELYAKRSDRATGLLSFLASLLDRNAADDASRGRALAEAALAGQMRVTP